MKIEKRKEELKKYLFDLVWFMCKPMIILCILCIPFIIYFLLVGYLSDKEALKFGYCILFIFILLAIVTIRVYFIYKKLLIETFSYVNENGSIQYLINKEDDEYIIENLNNGTIDKVKFSTISKINYSKNLIIIKTNMRKLYWFPKSEETMKMFKVI